MSTENQLLSARLAKQYGIDERLFKSLIERICSANRTANPQDMITFMLLMQKYDLNPFVGQLWAIPGQGGRLNFSVGIEGYIKIVNSFPNYDGARFEYIFTESNTIHSVKCEMHRKDRKYPTEVICYFSECNRPSSPVWRAMPSQMLSHRAFILAARYTFGLGDISAQEEVDNKITPVVELPTSNPEDTILKALGEEPSNDQAEVNKITSTKS